MKSKGLFLWGLLIVLAFLLMGCGSSKRDIQAVQEGKLSTGGTVAIGTMIGGLIGEKGVVQWSHGNPGSPHSDNPNLVIVQADLSSPGEGGKKVEAKVQFLYDRKTEEIELAHFSIDQQRKSLLDFHLKAKSGL